MIDPLIPSIHAHRAVLFADEWGRVWRATLDAADADCLVFRSADGVHEAHERRSYIFPDGWDALDALELRAILADAHPPHPVAGLP